MTQHIRTDSAGSHASRLATKPFVLLCAAMFIGYSNHWLLTPIIPLYVQDLGGSAFTAGLVLLAFAVPSFAFRPFVGHLADKWSAAGVLAVGLVLLSAGTALIVVPAIAMLFVANVVRGVGWAGLNTGGYTTLAIAAPTDRRGEAAGYYTSVTTSASIVFPALSLWLIESRPGFGAVFVTAAILVLVGLPATYGFAKNAGRTRQTTAVADERARSGLIDRGVLLATGLNLCSSLVTPSVMAFVPLYARSLGIMNIGFFYVLAGVTSIVVRPVLGKKSDAIGRGPAIGIGLAAQLIGLALIISAHGIGLILAGGFFVAIGMAMIGSASTALAMDLANPQTRGRAMATYSISFQIGGGLGAMIAGALADWVGLRGMYGGSIVITLAGFALLAAAWKALPQPRKASQNRTRS